MAVEIVILAPVMLAFILLVVAAGRLVAVKGDIEAAARDGARAASLERDAAAGAAAATDIVGISVNGSTDCDGASLAGSDFVAGGMVRISLTCRVSYDGLGLIGLPGSVEVTARSAAPIDTYRRTG